jgi:hypothetical protein
MGATAEDIETCLRGLADEVEFGADRCSDDALGKLADTVADVLAAGDVTIMRASAARISAFLRLIAGARVPAGSGPVVLSAGEVSDLGAPEGSGTVVATTGGGLGDQESDPLAPESWRDQVTGPLLLLVRQLRHCALVHEERERSEENREKALTIDDRVLEELGGSGPQRSGDIARRLDIDRAQASRSLTRLVRSVRAREVSARSQDGRGRWYELIETIDDAGEP